MSRPLLSAAVVISLLGLAHEALAGPVKLDPHFKPYPLVTAHVGGPFDGGYLSSLGYECGANAGYTSKQPAFTFELTEAMPELRIRLEDKQGELAHITSALVGPDGAYVCGDMNSSQFLLAGLTKGTYPLWFTSSAGAGASAPLRFEIPSR